MDDNLDDNLLLLENGVDLVLQQAESWLDSAKIIINYMQKRSALEEELGKGLLKLSSGIQHSLLAQEYSSMQFIYVAAVNQDGEWGDTHQRVNKELQDKFIQPLLNRRAEHKKQCNFLREIYGQQQIQLQETLAALQKSKSNYFQRNVDLDRAEETLLRASSATNSCITADDQESKMEKRKKSESDAMQKVMDAKFTYNECIKNANSSTESMKKVKKKILAKVRNLVTESDSILQKITVDYFHLMSTSSEPISKQFMEFCTISSSYEPGMEYGLFVKNLSKSISPDSKGQDSTYTFESYSKEASSSSHPTSRSRIRRKIGKMIQIPRGGRSSSDEITSYDVNSPPTERQSLNSEGMGRSERRSEFLANRNSCFSRSLDNSPTRSDSLHRSLVQSSSLDHIVDLPSANISAKTHEEFLDLGLEASVFVTNGNHQFRRLRVPSRCRECESYVYFSGVYCLQCGLTAHKRCIQVLHWDCVQPRIEDKKLRENFDWTEQRKLFSPDSLVKLDVIKKCINEIEKTGIEVKGIYRTSAVKTKVEKLCQRLTSEDVRVDLEDEPLHTICNALKMYLRQSKDVLLTNSISSDLIQLVMKEQRMEKGHLIAHLKDILLNLPKLNFLVMKCLAHHLKRIADHSSVNLMTTFNLAVVFGPTLFASGDQVGMMNILVDNQHQCRATELMIENSEGIFGSELQDNNSSDSPPEVEVTDNIRVNEDYIHFGSPKSNVNELEQSQSRWYVENPSRSQSKCESKGKLDKTHSLPILDISNTSNGVTSGTLQSVNTTTTPDLTSPFSSVSASADDEDDGIDTVLPKKRTLVRMRAYSPQGHRRVVDHVVKSKTRYLKLESSKSLDADGYRTSSDDDLGTEQHFASGSSCRQ